MAVPPGFKAFPPNTSLNDKAKFLTRFEAHQQVLAIYGGGTDKRIPGYMSSQLDGGNKMLTDVGEFIQCRLMKHLGNTERLSYLWALPTKHDVANCVHRAQRDSTIIPLLRDPQSINIVDLLRSYFNKEDFYAWFVKGLMLHVNQREKQNPGWWQFASGMTKAAAGEDVDAVSYSVQDDIDWKDFVARYNPDAEAGVVESDTDSDNQPISNFAKYITKPSAAEPAAGEVPAPGAERLLPRGGKGYALVALRMTVVEGGHKPAIRFSGSKVTHFVDPGTIVSSGENVENLGDQIMQNRSLEEQSRRYDATIAVLRSGAKDLAQKIGDTNAALQAETERCQILSDQNQGLQGDNFFEGQIGCRCLEHAMNNALGGHGPSQGWWAAIPKTAASGTAQHHEAVYVHGEGYNDRCIESACRRVHVAYLEFSTRAEYHGQFIAMLSTELVYGIVVHEGDHWTALRKQTDGPWVILDSSYQTGGERSMRRAPFQPPLVNTLEEVVKSLGREVTIAAYLLMQPCNKERVKRAFTEAGKGRRPGAAPAAEGAPTAKRAAPAAKRTAPAAEGAPAAKRAAPAAKRTAPSQEPSTKRRGGIKVVPPNGGIKGADAKAAVTLPPTAVTFETVTFETVTLPPVTFVGPKHKGGIKVVVPPKEAAGGAPADANQSPKRARHPAAEGAPTAKRAAAKPPAKAAPAAKGKGG